MYGQTDNVAHLEPFILLAVDIFDDVGIVNVKKIGRDPHNRAMLVMQALELEV
jgi:hypothetical protein